MSTEKNSGSICGRMIPVLSLNNEKWGNLILFFIMPFGIVIFFFQQWACITFICKQKGTHFEKEKWNNCFIQQTFYGLPAEGVPCMALSATNTSVKQPTETSASVELIL